MPSKDLRIVIVGGGHVGYHTAERLSNRGHDIVIIEKDED
jgi:trk system potassium uptake protein TrkA